MALPLDFSHPNAAPCSTRLLGPNTLPGHEGLIAPRRCSQLLQHLLPHSQVVLLVAIELVGERPELAVAVAQHGMLLQPPLRQSLREPPVPLRRLSKLQVHGQHPRLQGHSLKGGVEALARHLPIGAVGGVRGRPPGRRALRVRTSTSFLKRTRLIDDLPP